jgi:hypothetical protein
MLATSSEVPISRKIILSFARGSLDFAPNDGIEIGWNHEKRSRF